MLDTSVVSRSPQPLASREAGFLLHAASLSQWNKRAQAGGTWRLVCAHIVHDPISQLLKTRI